MPNENDIENTNPNGENTNPTDNNQSSSTPTTATSSDNSSDNNNTNDNVNTELEDFKQYAKIDYNDDDSLIQIFLAASRNYIQKATGKQYDDSKELHHLLKNLLTLHFYENRQSVNASTVNEVPFTIQNLLTFIQSTTDNNSTYELQEKEVVPIDSIQEVVADPEYYGLSKVTVQAVNLQNLTVSQNGEYEAEEGYSGIGKIIVNVLPNLEDKTITENGIYTPSEGKDGFNEVTVNVQPEPLVLEPTTVSSTASEQVINPPSGVAGFSKVNVNPVELENKTITENGVYTSETKAGFGEVTVNVGNFVSTYRDKTTITAEELSEFLNGETSIPEYMFYNDKNLVSIDIPEGVTYISYRAFEGCTNLYHVGLPSTLRALGGRVFYNCKMLYDIELPKNMAYTSNNFCNVPARREECILKLTDGTFNELYFEDFLQVKKVIVEEGLTNINFGFSHKSSSGASAYNQTIEEFILPESLTTITQLILRDFYNIDTLIIPDNVTTLKQNSIFINSSTILSLPANITSNNIPVISNLVVAWASVKEIYVRGNSTCPTANLLNQHTKEQLGYAKITYLEE